METIVENLHPSWKKLLEEEFQEPYFCNLLQFVESEYRSAKCYPEQDHIFSAFEQCLPEDLRVVIIGQDPYHGDGQAHGLCFSVDDEMPFPPSLKNIITEAINDVGCDYPTSGNLSRWARQGVLLLNSTLTVREGQAGSHKSSGWETFTDRVIEVISNQHRNLVFMLWGGHARKKSKLIDGQKHLILQTGHPSPLSANKGHWFGNRHFSKANDYLFSKGYKPIDW